LLKERKQDLVRGEERFGDLRRNKNLQVGKRDIFEHQNFVEEPFAYHSQRL
jgi:hypothetical protein